MFGIGRDASSTEELHVLKQIVGGGGSEGGNNGGCGGPPGGDGGSVGGELGGVGVVGGLGGGAGGLLGGCGGDGGGGSGGGGEGAKMSSTKVVGVGVLVITMPAPLLRLANHVLCIVATSVLEILLETLLAAAASARARPPEH